MTITTNDPLPFQNLGFSDINIELYKPINAQRSIDDPQGRLLASTDNTGQNLTPGTNVRLSNFRGHAYALLNLTSENNVDLRNKADATSRYRSGRTLTNAYVTSGSVVGSSSTTLPALEVKNFATYDKTLVNVEPGGFVVGAGGTGASTGFVGGISYPGGTAINVSPSSGYVEVNLSGTIGGGGGGGGFGGNAYNGYIGTLFIGGGGGGGGGRIAGAGGQGGGASGGGPGSPGSTSPAAFAGGPGGPGGLFAGNGGPGGGMSQDGVPGQAGAGVAFTWAIATGGGSGASRGYDLTGYNNIIFKNLGGNWSGNYLGPGNVGPGGGGVVRIQFSLWYFMTVSSIAGNCISAHGQFNSFSQPNSSALFFNNQSSVSSLLMSDGIESANGAGVNWSTCDIYVNGVTSSPDPNNPGGTIILPSSQYQKFKIIGSPTLNAGGTIWRIPVSEGTQNGGAFIENQQVIIVIQTR